MAEAAYADLETRPQAVGYPPVRNNRASLRKRYPVRYPEPSPWAIKSHEC